MLKNLRSTVRGARPIPSGRAAVLAGCVAVLAVLVPAAPASALGERQVFRDCGSNWIESFNSPGHANTVKLTGSCAGTLGANGIDNGIPLFPVFWGNSNGVWVTSTADFSGGHHYGCANCAASIT